LGGLKWAGVAQSIYLVVQSGGRVGVRFFAANASELQRSCLDCNYVIPGASEIAHILWAAA